MVARKYENSSQFVVATYHILVKVQAATRGGLGFY